MAVLDELMDVALTPAGPEAGPGGGALSPPASPARNPATLQPWRRRLVAVLFRGTARPTETGLGEAAGERFCHVCLRKLYVLCTQGTHAGDAGGGGASALSVACAALQALLARTADLAIRYALADAAADEARGAPPRVLRGALLCALDVVSELTLDSRVVDSVFLGEGSRAWASGDASATAAAAAAEAAGWWDSEAAPGSEWAAAWAAAAALVPVSRKLGASGRAPRGGREVSHLFPLYGFLIGLVGVRDGRVRDAVAAVLGLVGAELGLPAAAMGRAAGARPRRPSVGAPAGAGGGTPQPLMLPAEAASPGVWSE